MRITYRGAVEPSGFLNAELKLILVRLTLCIGYAGSPPEAAIDAAREISRDDLALEETVELLLKTHLRLDGRLDFLVAALRPSRLTIIRDGRAEQAEAGWLGDREAYAEYQARYFAEVFLPGPGFYDSDERRRDIEVAIRMGGAMNDVVFGAYDLSATNQGDPNAGRPRGGSHPSVGEAVITVVPRVEDNLFKYNHVTNAQGSWRTEQLPPGLGVVPPDFGSAERGAFSYSMLSAAQPGVAAVGIYFYEGRLGVLYAPLILDQPEPYRNATLEQFVELVRLRRDVTLTGSSMPSIVRPH
jgi:hypothetical protein